MSRDEVALRIFCAMMTGPDAKVRPYPTLGDNEVRIAFLLANTFLAVKNEKMKGESSVDISDLTRSESDR